jgi:hypothetical protein
MNLRPLEFPLQRRAISRLLISLVGVYLWLKQFSPPPPGKIRVAFWGTARG